MSSGWGWILFKLAAEKTGGSYNIPLRLSMRIQSALSAHLTRLPATQFTSGPWSLTFHLQAKGCITTDWNHNGNDTIVRCHASMRWFPTLWYNPDPPKLKSSRRRRRRRWRRTQESLHSENLWPLQTPKQKPHVSEPPGAPKASLPSPHPDNLCIGHSDDHRTLPYETPCLPIGRPQNWAPTSNKNLLIAQSTVSPQHNQLFVYYYTT